MLTRVLASSRGVIRAAATEATSMPHVPNCSAALGARDAAADAYARALELAGNAAERASSRAGSPTRGSEAGHSTLGRSARLGRRGRACGPCGPCSGGLPLRAPDAWGCRHVAQNPEPRGGGQPGDEAIAPP